MTRQLIREQVVRAPLQAVWEYFSDPSNLNDLTPPDMRFEILRGGGEPMYAGQLILYRVEFVRGLRSRWLTEIRHVREMRYFVDEQRLGPYRFWYHEHLFAPLADGTHIVDRVSYAVPGGVLGWPVERWFVRPRLDYIFDFRAARIRELFGEP